MDSIPIELTFRNLHFEGSRKPVEMWQKLLWVVADLEILVSDRSWLKESDFPVVELAYHLNVWVHNGQDFSFHSMESEEVLLRFVRSDKFYGVRSPWQQFRIEMPIPGNKLMDASHKFIHSVRQELVALGLSVDDVLSFNEKI